LEEKASLIKMMGFHNKIESYFNQLVRFDQGATVHTATVRGLRERIITQMLVNAHSSHQEGWRLLNAANEKIVYQNNLVHRYGTIVFSLLALFVTAFAVIIIRGVTYPLTRLHKGTEIIAEGNFDYKTNIRTPDEIGQLSTAVDTMTKNLKKITVSRDELSQEIEIRKQVEEALQEQTAIAQTFMDALPCVALLLKPRTREIVALNKAARDAGAQLGSTCFGSWPKTENACHFCRAPELWGTGEAQTIEIESIGTYWEAHWVPVSKDFYLHYALDITDRKRAEEERQSIEELLQRSEKMESLGLLAGGVAHDLNNVLGIVVGYAELILESVDASSSIKPHLVNIMNGGQKAAAIVDDLLTLARRGVSGKEVLNLNEIIADCQQSPEFEKLYSYHPAVKINTNLEPDLPNITCSSVHLGKSLYNLVSNAFEAMTKGGIVTIKTTSQYLEQPLQGYDQVRGGDYVVLSVSDTGEGIPAADLKRIFEPFYTKKVMGRSGTGLGLAVVWGTVKDHHGYINVQSEKGKGSAFTLYFPVTREDITAEGVPAAISEYMGKNESILVVDDVKEQRDLAAGMLKTLNYSVSSVSSGEEAVEYLKGNMADILILDMIMDPGMDGLDTYKSVIAIHPKQKAIIVSGFSESDRVHDAQELGAGAYVKKPYIKEKLGLAVRKELDRVV
ncbi:MAG: ATP-binding protein, partial [Deltaproteobacteria bacterium]